MRLQAGTSTISASRPVRSPPVYPEHFEDGVGDISAENGSWEVGVPTVGPMAAHSGQQCAGTVVGGDYPILARSRMVLPPVNLPVNPQDGQVWLRFWQWYYAMDWAEVGYVQVSVDGGAYQTLPNSLVQIETGAWTQALYDLSAYAGHAVRVAFYFESNESYQAAGWFVDDISIEEGALAANNPEDFESGIGDIAVENGSWEVGVPTVGPRTAHSGQQCAGTIVGGDYPLLARSRMVLPPVNLPASPQDGQVWLRFWQWYYAVDWAEVGYVQVSVDGGAYQTLPNSLVQIDDRRLDPGAVRPLGLCRPRRPGRVLLRVQRVLPGGRLVRR